MSLTPPPAAAFSNHARALLRARKLQSRNIAQLPAAAAAAGCSLLIIKNSGSPPHTHATLLLPPRGNVGAEVGLAPGGEEHGAGVVDVDVGQGQGEGGRATHHLACGEKKGGRTRLNSVAVRVAVGFVNNLEVHIDPAIYTSKGGPT